MLELLLEIPLCALLAGVLGLYIGYLLAKDSCHTVVDQYSNH